MSRLTPLSLRALERAAVNACRNSCRMRERAYGSNTGSGSAYDWRSDVQVTVYVCALPDGQRWTMRRYTSINPRIRSLSRAQARALTVAAQQVAA